MIIPSLLNCEQQDSLRVNLQNGDTARGLTCMPQRKVDGCSARPASPQPTWVQSRISLLLPHPRKLEDAHANVDSFAHDFSESRSRVLFPTQLVGKRLPVSNVRTHSHWAMVRVNMSRIASACPGIPGQGHVLPENRLFGSCGRLL